MLLINITIKIKIELFKKLCGIEIIFVLEEYIRMFSELVEK